MAGVINVRTDRYALDSLCSSCPISSPAVSPRCSASSRAVTAHRRSPDFRSCSACSVSCCCRSYWHRRPKRGFNKSVFTTPAHPHVHTHSANKIRIHFCAGFKDAVKWCFLYSDNDQRQLLSFKDAYTSISIALISGWKIGFSCSAIFRR